MTQKPRVRRQSIRTMVEQPITRQSSQDLPPITEVSEPTEVQLPTPPPKEPEVKRAKLGYALRTDLIKECARIALDLDKHRYEIIEDALELYIQEYRKSQEGSSRNQEI